MKVFKGENPPLGFSILLQLLAGILWAPSLMFCLMAGVAAADYGPIAVYYWLYGNFFIVWIGWPVLGVVSWFTYAYARRPRLLLWMSAFPVLQIVVAVAVVFVIQLLQIPFE